MTATPEETPTPTALRSIPEIVDALRARFDAGHTRSLEWRRGQLQRLVDLCRENADALIESLQADFGKPELEALGADVASVLQEANRAIKQLPKWIKPRRVGTPLPLFPGRSRIVSEPLGVVLIIAPWNYPVQLLLSPLVGAIAAGNCAVLKPSEVTPHTSALLADLVPRYLDPEAIALVEGGVEETTELLEQRWDHIMYTGNGTVARIVMEAAAKHLTPVTLELGGKSPCIVDASSDLPVTARRIAWGKFMNAGQTCIAPDYVLADERIEEQLCIEIRKVVEGFYGAEAQRNPDFGRIVNVRHHRRVAALLKDAGEVFFGGQVDEDDRYIAPTLLRDVRPDAAIMREEIFGPILPVLRVRDVDAAIDFVNERDKPLALYVFTRDPAIEQKVIAETSSGGACVNATIMHLANHDLPFGGVGPSGMGAYHGRSSFDTFSHQKSVLTKSTKLDLKFMYPPYSKSKLDLMRRML